ncbi:efflux RND transporter permease subunit [Paenibacillus sp. SYP-B4298]|uniref:efflux RND transporter permease subunit n=1 Tax=Paenibacillus sp. SYP-B4298 TaxID=2996034 RepID=UPI002FD83FA2
MDVSVRRPVGVTMLVLAVIALSLVSLRNLAVDLFPKIDIPVAVVATSYQGAAPEEIEKLVTRPMEASLSSIQGMSRLTSQSQANSSLVIMEFKSGTNLDNTLLDIREKVDQVKEFLPKDAGTPSVLRFDPQQLPIMSLALSGEDSSRLQSMTETQFIPFLERQKGVASVSAAGGKTREILVELNRAALARYGVAPSQIVQVLGAGNQSVSAGSVVKGQQEMQIRVKGEYSSVAEIRDTLILLSNGQQIRLHELAEVKDTYKEETSLTLVNGAPALVLSIQKQSDANTVSVADEIYKAMEEMNSQLPEGVELTVVTDSSIYIRQSIDGVMNNMLQGGILAVLILIVFLRSIRATLVIGIAIPIAVLSTFAMMYFTGQTLNIISMGGLALGIGMMLDCSIVILENIVVHRQRGATVLQAAVKGASELGTAVIASTVTSLVVFVPIVFVQGIAADIFKPMALTVAFSLLASLIVAITLVPMLSAKLMSAPLKERKPSLFERGLNLLIQFYKKRLAWSLKHRKTTVALVGALMVGSLALAPMIGMELMPADDEGRLTVTIKAPSGTRLEETKEIANEVEALLAPYESMIRMAYLSIGGSSLGFGGDSSNQATLTMELIGSTERDMTTREFVSSLSRQTQEIPGAEITVSAMETGLGAGSPIQIKLNGQDREVLEEVADQVMWLISEVEGVHNAQTSSQEGNEEMNIIVDRLMAAQYGLSYQQIISEIQLAMNGQLATKFREEGSEYDVRVVMPEEERANLAALSQLRLQTATGQYIPLSQVAKFEQLKGPVVIQRENQQRQINVTSDVIGRDLGSVANDIQAALNKMNFPEGYSYSMGGDAEEMLDSFIDLALALVFSIFLVYVVMAIQFESLLHPFIIMFSVPTSIIGVLIGLFVTNTAISLPALIGMILLVGVVVNNGIVLVDYINILRRQGMERYEAIMAGSPSRVRPILMMTLTTVLGMIPLALGLGEGSSMQAPLGIVVIFGLLFSTVFTLIFVPVVYSMADDFSQWLRRVLRRRGKTATEATATEV